MLRHIEVRRRQLRLHPACVQHTSAYVSIRQHTKCAVASCACTCAQPVLNWDLRLYEGGMKAVLRRYEFELRKHLACVDLACQARIEALLRLY